MLLLRRQHVDPNGFAIQNAIHKQHYLFFQTHTLQFHIACRRAQQCGCLSASSGAGCAAAVREDYVRLFYLHIGFWYTGGTIGAGSVPGKYQS